MAAGPHRGFDGFEVRAGLGVQQSGQSRHAVRSLWAQVQSAAARPIVVGEKAVGIQVVGYSLAQLRNDSGVEFGGMLYQLPLGFSYIRGRDAGGQHVDCSAHSANMVLAHGAGLHSAGQLRQLRRHRRTGKRQPRSNSCGQFEAARDFLGSDTQPRPQRIPHYRYVHRPVGRFGDFPEKPIHQPAVNAVLSLESFSYGHAEVVADKVG